ncbi:hypothetical protein GO730_33970 [Spirosoma sp. HMF3257]|uniref:hypothetical protein n=1 Tax=Spirosoma telluris TaxID=2183553 RepID=UPI0011B94406|nr:hypothetical protein [Spirosoma telluris]
MNHFILLQNPFIGSVCLIVLLLAVLIQLVRLRKHGIVYVSVFLASLLLLTAIFLYLDGQFFSFPRRYYGIV